ncbi:hypothetical protein PAMP_021715 [Pampus punctatissimus]
MWSWDAANRRSSTAAEQNSLGLVLTRGCGTSRHCQHVELPGVSVACCDWSLCNSG